MIKRKGEPFSNLGTAFTAFLGFWKGEDHKIMECLRWEGTPIGHHEQPPLLCYLELVSQDHVQACFNITKDGYSSRNLHLSSHFYGKNVLPCVRCDSGIALVEEMLHIVQENRCFWAGVPRVWFHSMALEQFMGHWVCPSHSPSCH